MDQYASSPGHITMSAILMHLNSVLVQLKLRCFRARLCCDKVAADSILAARSLNHFSIRHADTMEV